MLEVDEDGQAVWLAAKSLGEVPAGLKVEFEVDGTTSCLPLDVIDSSVRPKGGRARVATSAMPRKSSSPARDSSGDNRSSDDDSDYDDDCTSRHIKASKRTARAVVQPEVVVFVVVNVNISLSTMMQEISYCKYSFVRS